MPVGNAVIGALRAVLGLDTAQFETGLQSSRAGLMGFSKSMKTAFAAAATAVAAAGTVAALAIRGVVNEADQLSKASQKFGVPIEELSALKHAADLSDVSLEALGTGLRKLSQGMASGGDELKALGVNARGANGNLRPTRDVLIEIADRFARAEDGAGKTALAVKLFGKSGADLIPLLNAGSAGIREMTDEARELGLVFDKQTGRRAEAFNDNLTRLQAAMRGVWIRITAALLPAMVKLSDIFVDLAKNGGWLNTILPVLVPAFQAFATALIAVVTVGALTVRTIAAIIEQLYLLATFQWDQAWDRMQAFFTDFGTILNTTYGSIVRLWTGIEGLGDAKPGAGLLESLDDLRAREPRDLTKFVPEGYEELVRKGNEQVRQTEQLWESIGRTIEDQVVGAINQLIDGTLTWKSALASALQAASGIIGGIGSQSIANAGGWGSILGFANGGGFRVGGSGGIDSQLVAFRATPGEMVDVTKPGQERGMRFTFAPQTVIDARGSQLSEAQLNALLDQRDRRWQDALPGMFKKARAEGKV